MDASRRHALLLGALAVPGSALWGRSLVAQQPEDVRNPRKPGTEPAGLSVDADPVENADAPLVACLLIEGRKQTGKCELVRKRLQTEESRAFVQAEIGEHQVLSKLLREKGFEYPIADRPSANPSLTPAAVGAGTQVTFGKRHLRSRHRRNSNRYLTTG